MLGLNYVKIIIKSEDLDERMRDLAGKLAKSGESSPGQMTGNELGDNFSLVISREQGLGG